jgi:hypothetical protein
VRAYLLIREAPWYRRQAFEAGLRRAGYEVVVQRTGPGRPGDVLVIWNRYLGNHDLALGFERAGGRVLVAENGYIGAGGTPPKFDVHPRGPQPGHYYALAEGFHNGWGRWPEGGGERFRALGLELKPWRRDGEHVLVCPNRSFGIPGRFMPPDWAQRCAERLRKQTARPVRIRAHPGNDAPGRPLEADLANAWAVVIWSSSCGAHALAEGIPVFVEAERWIMKGAAAGGPIDRPEMPERLPHFERMAWAQWTCGEIESGEPFVRLLSPAGKGEVAAGT